MRLASALAVATLLTASLAAHADIRYGFVSDSREFEGTTFTVVSPDFLSYSSTRVAATGDYMVAGYDFGPIVQVIFASPSLIGVITDKNMGDNVYSGMHYDISNDGVYSDGAGGSLIISGSPRESATAVTPEPSSLALLGTGILGAVGAFRRRSV